jgi:hypothetical protein
MFPLFASLSPVIFVVVGYTTTVFLLFSIHAGLQMNALTKITKTVAPRVQARTFVRATQPKKGGHDPFEHVSLLQLLHTSAQNLTKINLLSTASFGMGPPRR